LPSTAFYGRAVLSDEGVTIKELGRSRRQIPWSDIASVGVWPVTPNPNTTLNLPMLQLRDGKRVKLPGVPALGDPRLTGGSARSAGACRAIVAFCTRHDVPVHADIRALASHPT
jgi:hypothetical protein